MLTLTFFIVAMVYATVGFGGGTSYLALLSVADIPYEMMPKIGLICNLLVVSGGCYHFYRNGHFNKPLIFPFVLSSVPMAFLGGMYKISERHFLLLLCVSLIVAGVRLLFIQHSSYETIKTPRLHTSLFVGGVLGLLSGLVGIGGGIFLSPLMLNLKWARPKEAAASASAFIWLNSVAGLSGQFYKSFEPEILNYWGLFIAVIIGGQIGSMVGTNSKVPQSFIQRGTAVLVLVIAVRLLLKIKV